MIMMTYELARRLEGSGVTVNALHPGFVNTYLFRNLGCASAIVRFFIKLVAKTPEQGASTMVFLATDPGVADVTGKYFTNEKPIRSARLHLRRGRPAEAMGVDRETWWAAAKGCSSAGRKSPIQHQL